jgi:signal transduction histidine kinase
MTQSNTNNYITLISLASEIGIITHKLNNLVFPILGFGEIIKMKTEGSDLNEFANNVYDYTNKLSLLLRRLNANEKLSKNDFLLKPAKDELEKVIKKASEKLSSETILSTKNKIDNETHIYCDRDLLITVFENILLNAQEASKNEATKISIELSKTDFDEKKSKPYQIQSGDYIHIKASDNGTGLTEEALDRALFPFFTTKPNDQHAGLGLWESFCKIYNMDGTITLENNSINGTIVNIYLPIN